MNTIEVLRRQWEDYPNKHHARANLLAHIVLVPLFVVGNVAIVVGIIVLSWPMILLGIVAMAASIALQGRSHKIERNQPEPFTGAGNALVRVFFEQWVTFPRFVLSGAWLQQLRSAP